MKDGNVSSRFGEGMLTSIWASASRLGVRGLATALLQQVRYFLEPNRGRFPIAERNFPSRATPEAARRICKSKAVV
jgi:hypothetical protein